LIYEDNLQKGMILSGSADSRIKIWVNLQDKVKNYVCCQTLVDHNGTILALAVSSQNDVIASSSTDCTIKIWTRQEGRDLLLYPFYECTHNLNDHCNLKIHGTPSKGVWVTALACKEGDGLRFLAGDSKGHINIYKKDDHSSFRSPSFSLEKTGGDYHNLIINQLLLVPQENFLFSISFDQYFKGLDATNGNEFVSVRNLNRCYFTSLIWDYSTHELIAGDEKGFIGVWNVYNERPLFWGKLFKEDMKILCLFLRTNKRELIVTTETLVEIFQIKRGQSSHDIQGHEGAILAVHAQEANDIPKLHSNNKPRFITCSLDNTIKVWDFSDFSITTSMNGPAESEISCMCYLQTSNLIATGHEDGSVMLWNAEIQNSEKLKCDKSDGHSNTVTAVTQALYKKNIEYLISVGYDVRICIWEITERNSAYKQASERSAGITAVPSLRNYVQLRPTTAGNELLCVTYDPDRDNIITGSYSGSIILINIQNTDQQKLLTGHQDSVISLALEKNLLYSGSDDKTIRIWDMFFYQGLHVLDHGHSCPIKHLMFIEQRDKSGDRSLDAGHLVSCGHDGQVILWNTRNFSIAKRIQRTNQLNCIGFLPEQNVILLGTEQCTIITVPIEPALGNPQGKDSTVNRAEVHMEKKIKMKRGEPVEFNDDTRSINSEDIREEYPDPAEELLQQIYHRNKNKK
jgi:WD40 repeat protein